MGMRKLIGKQVAKRSQGLSWLEAIDVVCSMLCITKRHLTIDSARAMVHLSWVRLGKSLAMDIPFNDIVEAVNKPVGDQSVPNRVNHIGPATVNIGASLPVQHGSATSPP